MNRFVSRRALAIAASLVALHFAIRAYVRWGQVLYDQGGLEGALWWLTAFFVFPAAALMTIVASATNKAFGLWGE